MTWRAGTKSELDDIITSTHLPISALIIEPNLSGSFSDRFSHWEGTSELEKIIVFNTTWKLIRKYNHFFLISVNI
jgi:hypothetical protein